MEQLRYFKTSLLEYDAKKLEALQQPGRFAFREQEPAMRRLFGVDGPVGGSGDV